MNILIEGSDIQPGQFEEWLNNTPGIIWNYSTAVADRRTDALLLFGPRIIITFEKEAAMQWLEMLAAHYEPRTSVRLWLFFNGARAPKLKVDWSLPLSRLTCITLAQAINAELVSWRRNRQPLPKEVKKTRIQLQINTISKEMEEFQKILDAALQEVGTRSKKIRRLKRLLDH